MTISYHRVAAAGVFLSTLVATPLAAQEGPSTENSSDGGGVNMRKTGAELDWEPAIPSVSGKAASLSRHETGHPIATRSNRGGPPSLPLVAAGSSLENGVPALLRSGGPTAPARGSKQRYVRSLDGRVFAVGGPQDSPERSALKKDASGPPEETARSKAARYRLALLKDELVTKAFDSWGTLDEASRLRALQRANDIHAAVFGLPQTSVLSKDLPDGTMARYLHSARNISIDLKKHYLDDPAQAFDTLSHESRHQYQWSLVDKLAAGALGTDRGEHALAVTFRDSFARYCCGMCPSLNSSVAL